MRVLLDTNVFIVAHQRGLKSLPKRIQKLFEDPGTEIDLSAISLTEVAIKTNVSKGLIFPQVEVLQAMSDLLLTPLPFTTAHAFALFDLPFFEDHRDPFDRMLIATALSEKIPILSSDRHFARYKKLQLIWD